MCSVAAAAALLFMAFNPIVTPTHPQLHQIAFPCNCVAVYNIYVYTYIYVCVCVCALIFCKPILQHLNSAVMHDALVYQRDSDSCKFLLHLSFKF